MYPGKHGSGMDLLEGMIHATAGPGQPPNYPYGIRGGVERKATRCSPMECFSDSCHMSDDIKK